MREVTPTVLVSILAAAAPAAAHTVGVSRGEYRVAGNAVTVELVLARPEMAAAVPGLNADADGAPPSASEVAGGTGAIAAAIVAGLEVRAEAGPCPGGLESAGPTDGDGVSIRAAYRCPGEPRALSVRAGFLSRLSVGHRHIALVEGAVGPRRFVLFEAQPRFEIDEPSSAAPGSSPGSGGVAFPLFRLGIEHILSGYDHLLFLFGLVLVGGRLRPLLAMVTAFTAAHSVTLGLAVLGVWAPSPRVVEPAIALSICYVGVENWFVRDAGRRWLVTAPFGLVHGFGFAGALREISLPRADVPRALLSFNLGVEAGQLAVLAAVLPLVLWLGRRHWFADRGVRAASAAIAVAGLVWFVSRLGVGAS